MASDRQATVADSRIRASKLLRLPDGTVLAWTGTLALALAISQWYQSGAIPADFPEPGDNEDFARLVVFQTDGQIFGYEQYGVGIPILDPFAAWGAGRDFALGAMAMGADARKAVEVACQFSTHCGLGVDAIDFERK